MAFVYKASSPSKNSSHNLGPGTYNFQDIIQSKPLGYAPFTSTVERFPSKKSSKFKKPEFMVPGPGAYSISTDLISEKILVSSMQNEMKIIEVPKESSVFKSKTEKLEKRLETKDITPGPGYYHVKSAGLNQQSRSLSESRNEPMLSVFLSTNEVHPQKKHPAISLIQDLRKNSTNKYQLIPSIPTQKEAFGYTEAENQELQLNKNPMFKYSGVGRDSIGPGQYDAKESLDQKGYSWWKSNANRMGKMKSQTLDILGPGCYNPSLEIRNLYKGKATSAFLSQLNRGDDKKNNKKYKDLMDKKAKINNAENDSNSEESHFKISALEEQTIRNQINENSVPGPGHYHNEKLGSSLKFHNKPISKQNFGSSDIRFKDDNNLSVGPGEYNPKKDLNTKRIKSRVKIPFISGITRFDKGAFENELPGPGSYNDQICLENDLIKKIQNGYKGNFGAIQKRFEDKKLEEKNREIPGPGHYSNEVGFKPTDKTNNCVFKSRSDRNPFELNNNATPGIGTYDLDYYNLNNSLNNNLEYEPFVTVKKPPFNTSEPRFINGFSANKGNISNLNNKEEFSSQQLNNNIIGYTEGNNSIMNGNRTNKGKLYEKNTKFNVKSQRFSYNKEATPGPGHYSGLKQGKSSWNKKTFNILFAEL